MTDSEFLKWLSDRIVSVYNESENVDFVSRLRKIADKLDKKVDIIMEESEIKKERPIGFERAMDVLNAALVLVGGCGNLVENISLKSFVDTAIRNGICIDVSVNKGEQGYIK